MIFTDCPAEGQWWRVGGDTTRKGFTHQAHSFKTSSFFWKLLCATVQPLSFSFPHWAWERPRCPSYSNVFPIFSSSTCVSDLVSATAGEAVFLLNPVEPTTFVTKQLKDLVRLAASWAAPVCAISVADTRQSLLLDMTLSHPFTISLLNIFVCNLCKMVDISWLLLLPSWQR